MHVSDENVRCAECHGDIHSTTTTAGSVGLSRLMKFGPDVTAYNPSMPLWAPVITNGVQNGGTCALTCHGKRHSGGGEFRYTYDPNK
jgi:hypothetical protein